MSWNPKIQIIDTRFIGRNILAFVETNDEEALLWANDNTPLKEFQQLTESVANRIKPIYPSLAIEREGNATDYRGDILPGGYEITLEALIYGTDASALPPMAKKYAYALESMLANVTGAEMFEGTSQQIVVKLVEIETQYDEIGAANKMKTAFIQEFRTKAVFSLHATAY
jgi:hypothetical protein